MKKYGGIAVVLILLLLLALFNRKEIVLNQSSISLNKLGNKGCEVKLTLTLYNSNLLSSTITNIDYTVNLAGVEAGKFSSEMNHGIAGRKEAAFPASIRLANDNLPLQLVNQLRQGVKLPVQVIGTISYRNMFSGGSFNFNKNDSVYVAS